MRTTGVLSFLSATVLFGGISLALLAPKAETPPKAETASPNPGSLQMPPEAPVDYRNYGDDDLLRLVDILNRFHRHSEAVEAGSAALSRNLTPSQDAFVRYKMAQSYEFLPNGGPLAKDGYAEILKMHPDYQPNAEIAYRLGELNDSIIMEGTEPNVENAIECFEYVVSCYEIPNQPSQKIYHTVMKAHMGLGILCWDQRRYDEAKKHFEAIYKCDQALLEPLPYQTFGSPQERDEYMVFLKARIQSMKNRIPPKLVGLCVRPDPAESIMELNALMNEYAHDDKVIQCAREAFEQAKTTFESTLLPLIEAKGAKQ